MYAVTLLLAATLAGQADHAASNPVYRTLIEKGIHIAGATASFPAPTMADGLDAKAQRKVIEQVGGAAFTYAQLIRKSPVSPYVLRVKKIKGTTFRRADVWFVAHGDLKIVTDAKFLDKLLGVAKKKPRKGAAAKEITAEDLAARGIEIKPENKKHEGYGYGSFDLIKKVRLQLASHSFWSETKHSVLTATVVDPRFLADKEFPNQWRALLRGAGGKPAPGPANRYEGIGIYTKITQLHEPKGALFIECHAVFNEPKGWFGGANLLGSKLPPVVQNQVRSARRHLMKAQQKAQQAEK